MQRKKILGSFYTPKVLADWMVERVLSKGAFVSGLEPSCGDGVFISSLLSKNKRLNITAIDIDSEAIKHVCSISPHITIHNSDFLTYKTQKKFNLIIGNPPYIAKKNLPKEQIDECKFIHTSNGLQNREISNIWTAFIVKSNELLDSKGTLALVLPAEFLQVKYAEEIRNFIADNFARVEILSFRNFRFDNTEQNTIILFAYKATLESKGIFFKEINSISELCDKIVFHKSTLEPKMKWTANCLTNDELSLIQKILKNDCVKPIDYYCTSVAGIVTAANSYFIISKNTVTEYNLKNYIKPIIKKGFFVNKKVCFKENDFQKLEDANNPCFLLSLENIKEYEFNKGLKKYL